MASAIVVSSPVHSISLPLGCSAIVEDPPSKEQTGTATTSFIDLNTPRTLSPATSLDQLPQRVVAENVDMHNTPYQKAAQRQLPTPPPPHSPNGDFSGYTLSQTPPDEIEILSGSPNSPAGPEGEQLDNRNEVEVAPVPDRDKWQFPVVDQPQRRNSDYDSDLSDPSPYAVVKNIMMDVDPASSHDPPEVCHMDIRENHRHHEPGYEEIDLRCPPSLPNSRPHSRLGRHIPSWQAFGTRSFEQPRSIRAALRETIGLPQMVRKHLIKAGEHLQREQLKEAISCLEWSLVQTNEYPRIQSLIWMLLGNAHVGLADFNRASICHLHYLAFCRERNDFPGITRAECNLGIAYMRLGLYKLAGRCFLQYLENCHLLQDDKGISVAYNNLGLLSKILATESYAAGMKEGARLRAEEVMKSNLNRAVTYFEQHLGLEEQFGNVNKQANAFGNLGICNELLKQYTQAIFYHNKRLEICRSIGDRVTESCALCNLGNCFRAIGKLEEALQYYILNLELTRSIEHKSGEMVTLLNLGTTYELLNKIDQAIEWYTLYLSMTVQRNDVPGQARGLCILASLYQEKKQLLKAHEYYRKLIGIFHQLGERDAEASAQLFMEMTKRAIEREKEQTRSSKWKKKRYSKKAMTVSRASGLTLPNPATIEQQEGQQRTIPRPQRVKPPLTVDGIATLTATQRTEFEKTRQKANIQSMDSLTSACVFENPAYDHLREEYRNGYVPGLTQSPAVHNEYYQQWMQRRADVEEATQLEAANGTRVSTSPVLSDSSWSHIRTPGLSPNSQVDWSYPNPYMCTFGVGFHLHPTARSQTAQSPQRVASPPFFPSINRACSPPVLSNGGYATVIRDHHNYDHLGTKANFDETSIEDDEDEDGEGTMPAISVNVTQHDREGSYLSRPHVMQSVSSCSIIGSQRHLQELEKLSHDFTQPRVDQQLDLSEGVDKEWEQWVQMQEDDNTFTTSKKRTTKGQNNALTRVVSMRETGIVQYRNKYCRKPKRSLSCRPAVSAPQLGDELPIFEEDLSDVQDTTSQYSSDA